MYMSKQFLCPFVEMPSYDAHLCGVSELIGLALNLVLLVSSVYQIVTGLTQRDQVLGTVTTGLPTLDMMDVQNAIFRFPKAPPADMPIAKQDVFSYIPEPQLGSLLVLHSFNFRMLDLMKVKLCHLDGD